MKTAPSETKEVCPILDNISGNIFCMADSREVAKAIVQNHSNRNLRWECWAVFVEVKDA